MLTNKLDRDDGDAPETARAYSSPACLLHDVDPVYLGYWPADEVLIFLDELLESARAEARALARMVPETQDPGIADLLREAEALHASSCVILWQEIEARKGRASPRTDAFYDKCLAQRTPKQRMAFANRGQERFARRIEKALPRVYDPALHAKLKRMLESHRRQIARWQARPGQ